MKFTRSIINALIILSILTLCSACDNKIDSDKSTNPLKEVLILDTRNDSKLLDYDSFDCMIIKEVNLKDVMTRYFNKQRVFVL